MSPCADVKNAWEVGARASLIQTWAAWIAWPWQRVGRNKMWTCGTGLKCRTRYLKRWKKYSFGKFKKRIFPTINVQNQRQTCWKFYRCKDITCTLYIMESFKSLSGQKLRSRLWIKGLVVWIHCNTGKI